MLYCSHGLDPLADAVDALLSHDELKGIDNIPEKAHAIAAGLTQMGVPARVVARTATHYYIGHDESGEVSHRSQTTQKALTLVQAGAHFLDPVAGLTHSSKALEAVHKQAFETRRPGEVRTSTYWEGDWEVLTEVPNAEAGVVIPEKARGVLIEAMTLCDEQQWNAKVSGLIKTVAGERAWVGNCLAVMAGVAVHMVAQEQLPVQAHRLIEFRRLGERSVLERRGVQLVSETLDDPLFEAMDLWARRGERIVSWTAAHDYKGGKDGWSMEEQQYLRGREARITIPMSPIQRWEPQNRSPEQVQAFMAMVDLLTRRHLDRQPQVDTAGPTKTRPRM